MASHIDPANAPADLLIAPGDRPNVASSLLALVTAYNEADGIAASIAALEDTLPGVVIWVADDGSSDGTADIAEAAGARVVRCERMIGKGGAATRAARAVLSEIAHDRDDAIVLLCDGDLGPSAGRLVLLVEAIRNDEADLAVALFARRVGGGLGVAVGFAGWAIRRRCGLRLRAPISGQRALRASLLAELLPFAHGFGMEIGMTIDAARAGGRIEEIELDLSHRATGRTLGGFLHRGRQLIDFVRVYLARR